MVVFFIGISDLDRSLRIMPYFPCNIRYPKRKDFGRQSQDCCPRCSVTLCPRRSWRWKTKIYDRQGGQQHNTREVIQAFRLFLSNYSNIIQRLPAPLTEPGARYFYLVQTPAKVELLGTLTRLACGTIWYNLQINNSAGSGCCAECHSPVAPFLVIK